MRGQNPEWVLGTYALIPNTIHLPIQDTKRSRWPKPFRSHPKKRAAANPHPGHPGGIGDPLGIKRGPRNQSQIGLGFSVNAGTKNSPAVNKNAAKVELQPASGPSRPRTSAESPPRNPDPPQRPKPATGPAPKNVASGPAPTTPSPPTPRRPIPPANPRPSCGRGRENPVPRRQSAP